jgi:hypothetical protein
MCVCVCVCVCVRKYVNSQDLFLTGPTVTPAAKIKSMLALPHVGCQQDICQDTAVTSPLVSSLRQTNKQVGNIFFLAVQGLHLKFK